MSHTNETPYLKLPQWAATDKPTWLGDMNQAMKDLDSGMAAFNTKVDSFDATVAAATKAANDATAAASAASQAASSAQAAAAAAAPLDSPKFVGNPTAPSPEKTDTTNRVATAAYVRNMLTDYVKMEDTGWVTIYSTDSIGCYARKKSGWVFVDAYSYGGTQLTAGAWRDFTTLPEQFRPDSGVRGAGFLTAGNGALGVQVKTDGIIRLLSPVEDASYWEFGIAYPAGN